MRWYMRIGTLSFRAPALDGAVPTDEAAEGIQMSAAAASAAALELRRSELVAMRPPSAEAPRIGSGPAQRSPRGRGPIAAHLLEPSGWSSASLARSRSQKEERRRRLAARSRGLCSPSCY